MRKRSKRKEWYVEVSIDNWEWEESFPRFKWKFKSVEIVGVELEPCRDRRGDSRLRMAAKVGSVIGPFQRKIDAQIFACALMQGPNHFDTLEKIDKKLMNDTH